MNRVRAFSLIELLVVIGIIGILASLLLPAFIRAKTKTQTRVCFNHLQQWGLATQIYVTDNADCLPPEGFANPGPSHTNSGWYIQLPAVLKLPRYHDMPWRTNSGANAANTVWLCPANPRRSNGSNLFHYCLNQYVDGHGAEDNPDRSKTMSSIGQPAKVVWLFESKNLPAIGGPTFPHTNLHNRAIHFTFVDGHVSRLLNREYWNFAANRPWTNNPNLIWQP